MAGRWKGLQRGALAERRGPRFIRRPAVGTPAGQVWLGYDAPSDVAAEHDVPADHPLLAKIADALNGMAEAATAK